MMILMRFCGDVVATGVIEVALAGAKISCRPRLRLPYAEIGFGKHDSASPIKLNNVPITISPTFRIAANVDFNIIHASGHIQQ